MPSLSTHHTFFSCPCLDPHLPSKTIYVKYLFKSIKVLRRMNKKKVRCNNVLCYRVFVVCCLLLGLFERNGPQESGSGHIHLIAFFAQKQMGKGQMNIFV